MRSILCCLLASASLASGCASIVSGTTQDVLVQTHRNQHPVEGASCELTNSKGTYHVTSPGTVPINRAYGDLAVHCEKPGMDAGTATVASSAKGIAFGNVLIGGAIGAAVDTASGAAFEYPELIRVEMGFNTVHDGLPTPIDSAAGSTVRTDSTTVAANAPSPLAPVSASLDAPAVPARAPAAASTAPSNGKPVAMDDLRHLLAPR